MADFKVHKVVSSLPGTLQADAVYLVRVGAGFDLYVTNDAGVARRVNGTAEWTGTATAYAAITSPDANTTYFVTG